MRAWSRRYWPWVSICLATIGLVFIPRPVYGATLSAQFYSSCATKSDGTDWCWGNNVGLQVNQSSTVENQPTPIQETAAGSGDVAVAVGYWTSLAVTSVGAVWGWGEDNQCQRGNCQVDGGLPLPPAQLPGLGAGAVDITAGFLHGCAVKTDGSTWCWGGNFQEQAGQLPRGGIVEVPTQVTALPTNAVQLSAGDRFTCTVMSDGSAWCWGDNTTGELGNGAVSANGLPPAPVTALGNNVAQISGGSQAACAVGRDGTAWCWGSNAQGQLGNGTTVDSATPLQVSALGNSVRWISAGQYHGCAAKTDGTAWCWGDNTWGQLGDGTTTNSSTPVQVAGLGNVLQIAAAYEHSCARESDGSVWCWGDNSFGELGDGTTLSRPTAAPTLGFAPPTPVPATGWRISTALAAALALSAMLALGRHRYSLRRPGL